MKKTMTLAEVKKLYKTDCCHETSANFLVNDYGKYRPNLTFVLSKEFELSSNGNPVDPIDFFEDKEITDNMNLSFNGSASFTFGDFWRSQKGSACFRPKDPMTAKHLLIRVAWGSSGGNYDVNIPECLYFRHARSNGGGVGKDYWVLPVGYVKSMHVDEIDGTTKARQESFEQRALPYRKKYSEIIKNDSKERATRYLEKLKADEAARRFKEENMDRILELKERAEKLSMPGYNIHIYDTYANLGCCQCTFSEEGLQKARERIEEDEKNRVEDLARRAAIQKAKEEYKPKIESLRGRIEAFGWQLSYTAKYDEEKAEIFMPEKVNLNPYRNYSNGRYHYSLSESGYNDIDTLLTDKENERSEKDRLASNEARIEAILVDTNFPQEYWHLFEGSEDLDSVIREEIKALFAARDDEKDEMELHELFYCGLDRRLDACYRVLTRNGGGKAKLNSEGQSNSRLLASFILGDE